MIRANSSPLSSRACRGKRLTTLALLLSLAAPALPAHAAIEADPQVLYQQMKAAYEKAADANWDFRNQEVYLSTIFNAGRAYSLQRPNDPLYAYLATLTVQIGSSLRYNPLTNHDATAWWVREASEWVMKNDTNNADLVQDAQELLARANSEDDPEALARYADEDAATNVARYPRDVDALLQQVEADWRGWLLTHDPSWRSLAFKHAADPNFPLANLPTTYGPEFLQALQEAAAGTGDYTADDRQNAQTVVGRLKNLVNPLIIATVKSVPHDAYLTMLAPADEYFGKMGYSILGIENELKHINFMLDYNYGNREADETVQVADSIDDMHRVYPRDIDMPKLLYSCITTLDRMTSADAKEASAHLKAILTVEYQDSPEARKLLSASTAST
jgi:hypothetical protein